MNKKVLPLIVSLGLFGSVAAGCGSGDGAKQGADKGDKTVTLRLLSTNPLVGEDSVKLFEQQNPGIKISYEYVPTADYSAKFAALAAAGEIPDVFWTQSGFYTDQIKQGLAMDLTKELKGKNYEGDKTWEETFVPALLDNARNVVKKGLGERETYDYGVPFTMTTIAVLYDKTIFDKLGLKPPTTWDQFMSNNEALKQAGYTPLSMHNNWIDWYPRLFWDQYTRDELTKNPNAFEDKTMTFSSDSVKKGLTAFKDLWDKGYFPQNGITAELQTMQQMFVQRKLGQFLIAPDKLEYIMNNAPKDMSLATYSLPGIAGLPSRSLGGSSNVFAVSASTKQPEEAVKLLKFITSKTHFSQVDALKYSNSGLNNLESDPQLAQFLSGFTNAAAAGFSPDILVPTTINTQISTAFKTDLLPNYLMGKYDLDYVCSQLQKIYEETRAK
ncbi:extracellular solute-binding protein [Paenibacillus doosanensis]|uniref:ABC transporter substrate-binding protein n=1 Tax=Paenibacillus doosanensis TaxID=1229154 RepID=UPI00217F282C|nr:extracellular solute-binding protein [Paenibacillus doosanensis]MCS7462885.1 extracellular solute-binding protein [Paenibacillus doosanensis]